MCSDGFWVNLGRLSKKIAAVKALELIDDQADERGQGRGAAILPGLQIVIISPGNASLPRTIGPAPFPAPAIDHEPARAE
jgi:hypothetical protein